LKYQSTPKVRSMYRKLHLRRKIYYTIVMNPDKQRMNRKLYPAVPEELLPIHLMSVLNLNRMNYLQ
jgi:hypothetical protein